MLYISLFLSFVKIGFTSFGGLSMIPLISDEMLSHAWMSTQEIADIVAIAEMTPGPLGLNCATFAGIKTAGVLGALCATAGVLTPTLTLTALAAIFFQKVKDSRRMQHILCGVRPSAVGMVFGVVVTMALSNYLPAMVPDWKGILIAAVMLPLLLKFKLSIPKVIGLSALFGIFLYGIL